MSGRKIYNIGQMLEVILRGSSMTDLFGRYEEMNNRFVFFKLFSITNASINFGFIFGFLEGIYPRI